MKEKTKTFNFFGEFKNSQKEKDYLQEQWIESKHTILLTYVICSTLLLGAGLVKDYSRVFVWGHANFLTAQRLVLLACSLLFYFLYNRKKESPKKLYPFATLLSIQASLIIVALNFMTGFISKTMFPGTLITTISFYIALQNRLRYTLIPTTILCLNYVLFNKSATTLENHYYLSFMLISINIILFFFKVTINKSGRIYFDLMLHHREVNKQKTKVLSIIGHDLKSPFTAIGMRVQQVSSLIKRENSQMALTKLKGIQTSVYKANDLLESLLVWAISENESEVYKDLNMQDTINRAIDHCRLQADQKEIAISLNISNTHFPHNKNVIGTVVRNIVTNAIKFSPTGSSVEVFDLLKNNLYEIHIKDNGQGIEEDLIKEILNGTNKKTEHGTTGELGTGVGLQLVHDLINRQDGKLFITSEKNKGTCFKIEFGRDTDLAQRLVS